MIGKSFFASGAVAQLHQPAPFLLMPRKPKPSGANFIALWRVAAGMTQEELADRAGLTTASISRIESGKAGYTKSSLENIALALQVEPWQLLGQRPGTASSLIQKLARAGPEQVAQIEAVADALLAFTHAPLSGQ